MELFKECPPGLTETLSGAKIGIAGTGGIGSNVAMLLARSGAGSIVAADFDKVELSNLNRQFFFSDQISIPKVEALKENLLRINPDMEVSAVHEKLTSSNLGDVFNRCDVLVEAVDCSETKADIIEEWTSAFPERPLIACSGIAGLDGLEGIVTVRSGRLSVVGDQTSDLKEGTFSAKVMAVASAMVIELYKRLSGDRCIACGGCSKTVLLCNGRQVPVSGFPGRMMEEVVRGMLRTLKGADPDGAITLEFGQIRS